MLVCTALWPAAAGAQVPDTPTDARFQFGPLSVDPRIAITNVGVDTNVYNDAAEPQSDFTATVGPEVAAWARLGRVQLMNTAGIGWNYFSKRVEERSFDYREAIRADVLLMRLTPHVQASYERTRQRPNLEIDARVHRDDKLLGAGLLIALGPRWSVDLEHEAESMQFDEQNLGEELLANALNRTQSEQRLTARFVMTPLTTFAVRAAARQDRFDESTLRNSKSYSVMPGLEFKPMALIAGNAYVGYRRFTPDNALVPEFSGVIATVGLGYTLRDFTKLEGGVDRDVDYSFDSLRPYFISTGVNGGITQSLGAAWDVGANVHRTRLAYQALSALDGTGPGGSRDDIVLNLRLSVGRRLAQDVRVGLDVTRVERRSELASRNYEGWKVGGSLSYGY